MPKERGKRLAPGITEMPDGQVKVRVTASDPATGQRHEREATMPASTTLVQAQRERRLLRDELKNNLRRPQPTGFVEDYAIEWLANKLLTLKTGPAEWYETIIAERVVPLIGTVRVEDVTRQTAQMWVARTDAIDNYSRSTRRGWWSVCKMLLQDMAADFGMPDPTRRVKPPKRHDPAYRREDGALSSGPFAEFMAEFRRQHEGRYPEVVALATTGIRAGELYGLMWDCVHYEQDALHIRRSASQGVLEDSTKSGEPRDVPLYPSLASHLRDRRKQQVRENHPGLSLNLVFPSTVGTARGSGSIRKPMKAVADEMGLSVRVGPQVLRRTVNTQLRQAGIDPTLILKQIGHADTKMGLHYSRHEARAMLDAMQGVFGDTFLL